MRIVTIDEGKNGTPGLMLKSGELLNLVRAALPGTLETWLPNSVKAILEAGDSGLGLVGGIGARVERLDAAGMERLRETGTLMPASTKLLAPIPNPNLVVAAGLAYRSHLAEMAGTPPPPHPTAFMKSPNSIGSPASKVVFPHNAAEQVDYEGELAVVFGRYCYQVSADTALDYVAGYTVANDMSARDWVRPVWEATTAWDARRTWEVNIMGKQFPGFTPLGPALLTKDEVGDVKELRITTRLNGTVMQSAEVGDLIFSIPEAIAYFSRWYAFHPGDVLLTGTPAGVGVGRKPPIFMRPGDVVEVEVGPIGVLRNAIAK